MKEKWEYEFKEEKKRKNLQLQTFLKELELFSPLEPRDAFYGGRTGAASFYVKAESGEDIKYVDVTSLYPFANKYKEYLVRFPLIYTNPLHQDVTHYFGIAQVDILPPERLFYPVFPVRARGKLTFPLCAACVQA